MLSVGTGSPRPPHLSPPPSGCPTPGVHLGECSAGCRAGGGGLSPLGKLWGRGMVLVGLNDDGIDCFIGS